MTQIALVDAQQRLAEIIDAVRHGEEFVITLEGKPVAVVSAPANGSAARRFGSARGKIGMAKDFDAPLDDFTEYM